jgi:hypothetical protein
LTLISANKNVELGNCIFAEKVTVYKDSFYAITNQLEKIGEQFGLYEIKERQAKLAALAVKTWSTSFAD